MACRMRETMKASTRTTDQARSSGTHGAHGGARIGPAQYLGALGHVKRTRVSSTPICRGSTKQSRGHSAAVGRNQTKARIARVPRHVGFRPDQASGGGTANNAENANGALARPGGQT
jgi:hypothetical protein